MSNRAENVTAHSSGDYFDWTDFTLKEQADLERQDRRLGHEYIPMDIYVDLWGVIEHFQASSICPRRKASHPTDAGDTG